ncbi:MAG: LUD domain-containing protein [Cruoricaptor ignavus]|nr:LUD domain-containing protein [Cruoricaptor ignavus]
MSSKEAILSNIRKNLEKRTKTEYPEIETFEKENADLLSLFKKNLEIAAGTWYEVNSVEEAQKIMSEKLPNVKVICSATDEWKGNKSLSDIAHPQDLQDVDLGVIRAGFGVAEMGMVWLTEHLLKENSIGFLSQHLAILLDPEQLTENMHTAYQRTDFWENHYGCFMMGPSATADIGATLVHGAQGARSLTVFFLKG